ncbi:nitrile hydratase subunit beta [Ruegeria lacuscaerulensis]|uniref:nitrile hydratase subunit beta n=1 Tax=Ruegeria lacuscaerulensis TaxID=55218 RepID=UPI00147A3891|nr:nitrile hydratase subunit beta [Ruegeria lacuscaerulensis]
MDGIHDMGGMHGFGPVPCDQDRAFDHDWQKRAFALTEALAWSVPFCADEHRAAIERIAPEDYLRLDYFEKWTVAATALVQAAGLVDPQEVASGRKRFDIALVDHPAVGPADILAATKAGAEMTFPPTTAAPRFTVGQSVRVLANSPAGHTRVPRYVRNHVGQITLNAGVFQFADTMAVGQGPSPQHCYCVEFLATDLWGNDADPKGRVCLDLWENYLEPA